MKNFPATAITAGRIFFSIALIAFGAQQIIVSNFITVILPYWPEWLPGKLVGVYLISLALIISGIAILLKKNSRSLCLVLGGAFLLLFLIGHLPYQLAVHLREMGAWTNSLKTLTLSGGAFLVAASMTDENNARGKNSPLAAWLEKFLPAAPVFISIFMIFCGIEHFVYADFVAMLVPAWIPPAMFWTYFAGVALIGAGAAIILKIKVRTVATLLGVMIFLWLLVLHIPRAVADPAGHDENEVTSVFEALCFSGFAFVLAAITPATATRPPTPAPAR
jgi:uncharacterized membrane protein